MKNENVTKKDILELLRENSKAISKYPNGWRVLFFKKQESKDGEMEEFDVQLRCQRVNLISLVRDLYKSDEYGLIKDGAFGSNDFSYVSTVKELVNQLKNDGYVILEEQKCLYFTEFGKKLVPDGLGGIDEVFVNPEKYFTDDEKKLIETSITLTTKGHSWSSYWRDKINSEPLGVLSFLVASAALIISILTI